MNPSMADPMTRLPSDWPPRLTVAATTLTGDELSDAAGDRPVVDIVGTVRIATGADQAMAAVRLLREASAFGVPVNWSADITPQLPAWILTHLPPPHQARGISDTFLLDWRSRFRYGLCYYRRGPGFLVVRDARRTRPTRVTLPDPVTIMALECLDMPRTVGSLPVAIRDVLPDLHRLGLVIVLGEQALTLTWRPRRWPVPCVL